MLVYDKFYRAYEAVPLAEPDPEDADIKPSKVQGRDYQKTIAPIPNTTTSHLSEQFRKFTEKVRANPVMYGVGGLVVVIILFMMFGRRRRR